MLLLIRNFLRTHGAEFLAYHSYLWVITLGVFFQHTAATFTLHSELAGTNLFSIGTGLDVYLPRSSTTANIVSTWETLP